MTIEFGILGPQHTFTDLAAQEYLQKAHISPQTGYFSSIRDIVEKVANGALKSGIVPYENSIGGPVKETHEALQKFQVTIIAKIVLPIQHALVGLPTSTKENITTIISHPQAFKQCHNFLQQEFPQAQQREAPSTMAAWESIQQQDDTTMAAIIPLESAVKVGASILAKDIGDRKNNQTTFLVFQAAS